MLTEDDLITDLARLRERGVDLEYTGEIPLTRRSVAATVAPVAALAAVATIGAAAVIGSDEDERGPASDRGPSVPADESVASPDVVESSQPEVRLVDARITLAGKTFAYQHPVGEDPFAPGWQLAIVYGSSLPANATRFTVSDGSDVWVAEAPASADGKSVLIVLSGPDGNTGEMQYVGMASAFTRAGLEDWVRSALHGR